MQEKLRSSDSNKLQLEADNQALKEAVAEKKMEAERESRKKERMEKEMKELRVSLEARQMEIKAKAQQVGSGALGRGSVALGVQTGRAARAAQRSRVDQPATPWCGC